MKKTVLTIAIATVLLTSCSNPDPSKRYFLESGDLVIAHVGFSTKMIFDYTTSKGRVEYRNDSIFLKGDAAYNKYGEKSGEAPLTFVATYNKDGIVNTDQLMAFVNTMDSTDAVITKVTIK